MSILLVMWAAKQTKKGVHKADVAIKRRSQMRYEKRMTKLGLNVQHFSSLPDLAEEPEDPFADPHSEHDQEWESLEPPSQEVLSKLPPDAAEAVNKFVKLENETRKSYYVGRGSLDLPSRNSDFPPALKLKADKEAGRRQTSVPPNRDIPGGEENPERPNLAEINSNNQKRSTFNIRELQTRKNNVIKSLAPQDRPRPGSRFLRRVSTWRGSVMPRSRMIKSAEADF